MDSQTERIIGYILIGIGLVCILFSFYSMYNVFTNVVNPPEIFKMQSLSLTTTVAGANGPAQINIALDQEARKVVDMFLYYLFMFFVVIVGSRLGSLGIQFIKEIKVQTKN